MSFVKGEIMDLCRICETVENLLDISTEEFSELNRKLHKISEFEDKYNCWLRYICTACSKNLQNAFEFKTQCEFTYKKLVDQIENINQIQLNKHIKQEEEEDESSLDFDRTYSSEYNPPSTTSNTSNIKKLLKRKKSGLDNNSSTKTGRLFVCEHCEKIFNGKTVLMEHMNSVHLNNEEYTCETCGAKLKNNSDLINHQHIHSGRNFSCDTCGKAYTTEQYLKRHRKAHFEKRKPKAYVYLCHFCGQGASDLHYYEEHLRIHSGERPFKCDKCNKSFAQMQGLKVHSITHSDKRPHACQLCKCAFRKKSHLNGHMISHTGERNYKCQVCEKTFTQSSGLKNHLRLHTGELPYECSNCLMKFRLRKMLVNHKKKCQ